jgi:cell division protein FtsW
MKPEGESVFTKVIMKQFIFGLVGAMCMFLITYKVPYKIWQKYAMPLFIISLIVTALVLVPGIGSTHGGATRWIDIGGISFQPGEFLKLGFVVYFAAWLSAKKQKVETFYGGFVPLCVFLAIVGALLLAQPHTGMLVIICLAAASMFVVAGGRWRYLFLLAGARSNAPTIAKKTQRGTKPP